MQLYIDCFSGISGDMTLGALIDLGVPAQWLTDQLQRLPLQGFTLNCRTVQRRGLHAVDVEVATTEDHPHRSFATIRAMIENSPLTEAVKTRSLNMFTRLAEAEAGIHGEPVETVHFHEVGGVDAIVDIVGTALGMAYLKVDGVVCASVPLGSGTLDCRHGTLPVPAPATVEILKGVPVYGGDAGHEVVTPTGATIVAEYAKRFGPLPPMVVEAVGYGAGKREGGALPNLLRLILGKATDADLQTTTDEVYVLETNIDDMNPELYGHLMEGLLADGALDVSWTPIQMKKNRPAIRVEVIAPLVSKTGLMRRLLEETTSIGVRYTRAQRLTLKRQAVTVDTPWGPIAAKQVVGVSGQRRIVPEYEVCRKIAAEHQLHLRDVYTMVMTAKLSHGNDGPATDL
ncbi:MAG: nickel pincer cofactor biosynthesis protein LarC [Desulfosarcinaceae bacterium]|nr:nickel pincer cofactor biosynthesis protein LarC [Desulfosarcinaceae bacterium]